MAVVAEIVSFLVHNGHGCFTASLLPGFLSPRAKVLRLMFRGLTKVIDAVGS